MTDLALNVIASYRNAGALSSVTSDLNKVEKATKTASQSIKDFGKGMSTIGAGLTAGVTLPLVGLGIAAIKAGNELNAGLANIQSLGVASARVKELKGDVQDMQIQFGKSAKELTDGLYQITSAFGDTKDSAKELEIAVKTGVAGVSTTTEAINLLSAVTKAWGDTSVAAQTHVADLALKTVELGQTTLPELAGSLGDVTASTNALGIKQEEMFSIYSSTTGVLGNTAKVTIGYKGILQSLMTPTESMSKLFKGLGVSSGAAMIQHFGLEGSILRVVAAQKKSGESLQKFIPMADGQSEAMLLAGTVAKKYTSDLEAMNKASGKMEDAYKSQVDGPNAAGVAMDRATQKIQVMLERIHDGLGPAMLAFTVLIDPLVNKLLDLTNVFSNLDPTTQTWIVGLAGVAATIGPLLFGVGKFIQIAGVAMPVIGGLVGAMSGLLLPLGLLATAYALNVGGMRDFANTGLRRIREAAPLAGDAIKGLWHNLTNIKDNAGESTFAIYDFVTALTGSEAAGMKATNFIADLGWKIEKVKQAFNSAGGGAAGFVAGFTSLTGIDLTPLLGKFKAVIAEVQTSFSEVFSGDISIGQFVAKLSAALSGVPDMLSTLFSSTDFSAVKTQVVTALGLDNISFDGVIASFKTFGTNLSSAITGFDYAGAFSSLKTTVSAGISSALSAIDWSGITVDLAGFTKSIITKFESIDWTGIAIDFAGLAKNIATKFADIDWTGIGVSFAGFIVSIASKFESIDWSGVTIPLSKLTTQISNQLSSIDWAGAAASIGTKAGSIRDSLISWLTNQVTGINWSGVSLDFAGFINGISTKLNSIDWSQIKVEDIGKALIATLAPGLTAAVAGIQWVFDSEKWAGLVTAVKNAFTSIQWGDIGTSLLGLGVAVKNAITNLDWSTVTVNFESLKTSIVTRLGQIDWGTVAINFGQKVNDLRDAAIRGLTNGINGINWSNLSLNLAGMITGITAKLNNIDWSKISALDIGKGMVAAIMPGLALAKWTTSSKDFVGLEDSVINAVKSIQWGAIGTSLGGLVTAVVGAITGLDWSGVVAPFSALKEKIQGAINSVLSSITFGALGNSGNSNLSNSVNGYGSLSGGGGGSGGFGSNLSPQAPLQDLSDPNGPGFAMGTNSFKGGLALVGEQGPELAIFPGGTQILSNPNTKTFLGGIPHFADGTVGPPRPGGPAFFDPITFLAPLLQSAYGTQKEIKRMADSVILDTTYTERERRDRANHPVTDATEATRRAEADSLNNKQSAATQTGLLKEISKSTGTTAIRSQDWTTLRPAIETLRMKAAALNPPTDATEAGRRSRAAGGSSMMSFGDMQKIGRDIAKSFKGTVEEFKSALQKVPGLFGTSSVTPEDMADAKAGTYKPKADEKLRQLKDLAEHGVQYAGLNVQDFKDALGRIGVKASDDLKTLTGQVTAAWNDQSLFSDKKNISSLIDINAVKASVTQQQVQAKQQAAGNANLMALFGLQPEAVKGQAQAFGSQFRTDALAGFTGTGTTGTGATGKGAAAPDFGSILLGGASITPESVAPLAASFLDAFTKALAPQKDKNGKATGIDFGAKFADSINESLKTSTALDSSGQAIFQKLADAGKNVNVDFMKGIATALDTNVGTESSIKALNNVGQKIGEILKQGIGDFFKGTDMAAAVANGVKPAAGSGVPAVPTPLAIGTNSSPGGYVRVGDTGPEMLWIPPRSGVYPQRDGAGGGNTTHVTVNASVANGVDVRSLAYQVADILQRKAR